MIQDGKIKKSDLISAVYIILICLNVAASVLVSSNVTTLLFIDKQWFYSFVSKWSVFLFLAVFLFGGRLKRTKMTIMMCLSITVVAITLMTKNRGFAILYAAILAFPEKISLKKIAKWESYTFASLIGIIVLMYSMGSINADTALRGNVLRVSCGFASPNAFGNTVLLWMITYVYYKFDTWKTKNLILCLILSTIVFHFTNSRMSFAIELLILIVVQIWTIRDQQGGKGIYKLSSCSFSIFSVFCLTLTYIYDKGYFSNFLTTVNVFMSYRLGFMRKYFHNYGLKPFGQIIETVSRSQQLATGEAWSGLDNSYMYIMICWGIIITVVLCIMYWKLGKNLEIRQDRIGALCVVILCIVGLTESYLSNVAYNFSIMLIANMLNGHARDEVKNDGRKLQNNYFSRYDSEQRKSSSY